MGIDTLWRRLGQCFEILASDQVPGNLMKRYLLAILPLLAACANTTEVGPYLSPYRIDVRQGNFVSQEMVVQLKPGLTREQVRFILGSPLIVDLFHSDRWDYIYRFKPSRGELQERRLTVFFQDNKLARVAGDVVDQQVAGASEPRPAQRVIEIPAPGPDKK